MNGILIVNKPQNFTSFDIVAIVRKLTHCKKVGHSGTLDPMATGVLPILIGNATKAQSILPDTNKTYCAEFKLGLKSNTLDIWGNIIKQEETFFTKDNILQALPKFKGDIFQIPPMFSAVQVNGQRLYDLARKGLEIKRDPRSVNISKLELISFDKENQSGKLLISCSKGTYIRTLISDLACEMGTNAVMTALIRTDACGYNIKDSYDIVKLKDNIDEEYIINEISKNILPIETIFNDYIPLFVTDSQFNRFSNGGYLDLSRTGLKQYYDKQIIRIKNKSRFGGLGIVDIENNVIKIYKIFNED